MQKVWRKAYKAGHKEGKHRGSGAGCRRMRSRGIDDQAIMEMTGLSEDELQRLRH
ncbi:hypothetical protein IE980_28315 [Klebsiella pneumoniae]|uniref:Uncharacterized protein n=1 Tax=Klebsiella pneumoniae TaxID=573 RepID=A0A927HW22_KLEPN|nr:hypothetical protein [Klebsiella pneumoniae]